PPVTASPVAAQPKPVATATAETGDKPKAKSPATPAPSLRLTPQTATLEPGDVGVQFIVEGPGQHGGRRDLTGQARWSAEPAGIVAVEPTGYVRPLKAGKVTVRADCGKEVGAISAELTVAADA